MRLALLAALLFVASAFVLPPAHAAGVTPASLLEYVKVTPGYSVALFKATNCVGTCPPPQVVNLTATGVCSYICYGVTYSWVLRNPSLGTLSATTGSNVQFTPGSTLSTEYIKVYATYQTTTVEGQVSVYIVNHQLQAAYITPPAVTVIGGKYTTASVTAICDGGCPPGVHYAPFVLTNRSAAYLSSLSGNNFTIQTNDTAANVSVQVETFQDVGGAYPGSPQVIVWAWMNISTVATVAAPWYHLNAQLGFGATNLTSGGNLSVYENYTSVLCGSCQMRPYLSSAPLGCTGIVYTSSTQTKDAGYCYPRLPGTYPVNLTISVGTYAPETGFSISAYYYTTTNLTVYTPMVVAISATPNPVIVGNNTFFTESLTSASGGVPVSLGPASTFAWSGLPNGCSANDTVAAFSCVPSTVGTFQVDLKVRGMGTAGSAGTLTQWYGDDPYAVTVVGTSGGANLALSASPVQLQPGGTVTYWVNTTDSLKLYWAGLPSGCVGPNKTVALAGGAVSSTSFACVYPTAGTYVTNLSATYCPSNACTTILRQIQIQVGAITPGTPGGNGSGGGNGTGGGVSLPTVAAPIVDWTLYFLIFVAVAVFAFFVLRWATSSPRNGQR